MAWLLLFVLLLLLLAAAACAVLLSDIRVRMHFVRTKENDSLAVEVRALYGLYRYCYDVPHIDYRGLYNKQKEMLWKRMEEERETHGIQHAGSKPWPLAQYREMKRNVTRFPEWMKQTLARFRCTELRWDTRFGVGDAPVTAVLTGAIWGVLATLLGFVFQYIKLDTRPDISVTPLFNRKQFHTEANVVIQIRAGAAMLAGIRFWFRVKNKAWLREKMRALRKNKHRQPVAAP
jgi:hypothetical protein